MFLIFCGIFSLLTLRIYSIEAVSDCKVESKQKWSSLKLEHVEYLPRPIEVVIIMETKTRHCAPGNYVPCDDIVRDIQLTQVKEFNYTDIGFSFLIGGDLKVYEGAGWLHVANHTLNFNRISIGIAFIGTYDRDLPSIRMMKAAKEFLECGVKNGHLTSDYQVLAQSQLIPSKNPGIMLYNEIMTWPEWERDTSYIKFKAYGTRYAR